MSYLDCAACLEAGTAPVESQGLAVKYDPRYQRHGLPTNEHGMSAAWLASMVWHYGLNALNLSDDWPEYTREEQVVACWWAGRFGTLEYRQRFGAWAKLADRHLWHGCCAVPDPPRKGQDAPNG